jgi:hypothetical protein
MIGLVGKVERRPRGEWITQKIIKKKNERSGSM